MDKYGRILANVFEYPKNDISVNQMLIDNKFARAYGGDLHKNDWSLDELNDGIISAGKLGIVDNIN